MFDHLLVRLETYLFSTHCITKKKDLQMFLSVKRDSFSLHCRQVLSHTGLSDCWAFLSIIVASLPYKMPQGNCCCNVMPYKKHN